MNKSIFILLILLTTNCIEQGKTEYQDLNNIQISQISERLIVVDGSTDTNLNYCEGEIREYSEMEEYDCSFLIDRTEYNLREKFLYDLSGKVNSYWIYKSEGPAIFSLKDLHEDDKYAKSIGADKTPKIVGNKIAYGTDTLRIEIINDEYKLLFMELNKKIDKVRFRTIYKYK